MIAAQRHNMLVATRQVPLAGAPRVPRKCVLRVQAASSTAPIAGGAAAAKPYVQVDLPKLKKVGGLPDKSRECTYVFACRVAWLMAMIFITTSPHT